MAGRRRRPPRAGLRRGAVRRPQPQPTGQGGPRRQYRRRHPLRQLDRRFRAGRRLARPGFRSPGARVLLRACAADPHTALDGLRQLPEHAPMVIQERAYTSPIWYTP
ncbi:MAG: DUF3604 domain-containing protein [Pseudomonadales bacterium]|nr:DUF3604 domain-containing protein [Pseudomonadales bacterium]